MLSSFFVCCSLASSTFCIMPFFLHRSHRGDPTAAEKEKTGPTPAVQTERVSVILRSVECSYSQGKNYLPKTIGIPFWPESSVKDILQTFICRSILFLQKQGSCLNRFRKHPAGLPQVGVHNALEIFFLNADRRMMCLVSMTAEMTHLLEAVLWSSAAPTFLI